MSADADHRRLPPLTALRVLEALYLAGSVTGAAQRLHVSHSAVSHQIKTLEEWSDVPLFMRRGRATVLTDAGRSLAAIAHGSFDAIRHEIDRLPIRRFRPVTVAALPIIATELIMPGLARFMASQPDVRLHLSLALTDRPTTPAADLEILFIRRTAVLATDIELLPGDGVPAAAPALLETVGGDIDALMKSGPFIHDEDMRMWPSWNDLADVPRLASSENARMILEGSGLIHRAVLAGLGVGFVRRSLAGSDIASGRLVVLSDTAIDADWVYVLRCHPDRAKDPEVTLAVLWLTGLSG